MGVIDDIILAEARKSGRTATKSSVDKAIRDAAPGLKAVASRITSAEEKFVKWAMKSAKLTKPQAEKALATMRKLKVVKIDANVGQFTFKHGAFAEPEVVRRAAGLEEDSMSNSIDDIVLEDVMGKTMGFAPPPKVKGKAKAKVGGTVSFVNPDTGKTQKLKVTKIDGTTIWAKGKGGSEYSIVMTPGGGDPENMIRWPTRRGSFPANPRYKKGSFKFEGVEFDEGIDKQGPGENKEGDTDVVPAKDGKWNVFQKKDGKWKKVAGPFDDGDAAKNAAQKIEKAKSESLDENKTSWTVEVYNGALKNLRYVGAFDSKGEAEAYAKKEAKRTRPFMKYVVYTGTPKAPGKAVSDPIKGAAGGKKAKNESLDEAKIGGMGKWGKSRKDIVKILDKGSAPDMSGAKALASKLGDDISVEKKGKMLLLMNASGTPVYGVGPNNVVWYYYQGLREHPVGFVADAKKASVSHEEPKYPEFKGLPKEDPWLMAAKIDPKNPALPAHLREASDEAELTMESLAEFARGTARERLVEEDLDRIAEAAHGVSLESMPRAFERKPSFGAPNLEYGIIHEEDEYLSEALPSGTVEMFLLVMQNQLIAQDKTEMKRALRARRPDNPYRLGLFMKGLNSVREDVKDIIHNDDKESLTRLKTSLSKHFNNFPPLNRTLKAIDKFIATGKKPTLTKLKEHSSAISPRPAGGPLQESNERELFEMIEKCTPGGVPESIMESLEAGVAEVIDDLHERKSKGDYGRGAGGRSSELSWKSGPKPNKDTKKAASKGERRGKKAHIDAQMRGEDIEELALLALLGE